MRGLVNFIGGAIAGSLVGAALALLLAPASGDELRSQIKERKDHAQQEIELAMETRRAELERELAALRAPRQ